MHPQGRKRARQPVNRMAETLEMVVSRLGLEGRLKEEMIFILWPSIVGEGIARNSRPLHFRDRVLTLRVRNSIWANQLSLLKNDIIEKIRARIGNINLEDLRFVVGDILDVGGDDDMRVQRPRRVVPRPVVVSQRVVDEAKEVIPDPALRSAFLRAVVSHLKLRDRRLTSGWRPCLQCGVLCRRNSFLCPLCRLKQHERR